MSYPSFSYQEPEGTVRIEILPAVRKSEHREREHGGPAEVERPRLRVTTHPGTHWDDRDYVTLRGRKYSIEQAYLWETHMGANGYFKLNDEVWSSPPKGLRNEAGAEVDYKSKTSSTLWEIARRVQAKFVAEHPEWEAESVRLLVLDDLAAAENDIRRLQQEQELAAERVRRAQGRLGRVGGPVKRGPRGGDAVRLAYPWPWAGSSVKVGDIGVLSGVTDRDVEGGSITFHASTHRGDGNVVSCSGGPATIHTPASELLPTEETITLNVWRWNAGGPGKGNAVEYTVDVPVWEWIPADD